MPAAQLHLTFCELMADQPTMVAAVKRAVASEPAYVHLGAVFHDLPYYGNMIAEVIRYGLCRPAIDAPWAYRVHCLKPDRFAASFIEAARATAGLTENERLALVAGMLSHCALDLTLHPLANYCARRDYALYGGYETYHHRMTEKYQALFFHVERFGEDVIGTPAFARKTRLLKHQSFTHDTAEPAIVHLMDAAYRGAYGDAPSALRWIKWVRNFHHFGLIVSSLVARRNSQLKREDENLRTRYFRSAEFDFSAWYERAEKRACSLIELGYDYFQTADFSTISRQRFCEAANIDDLVEPRALDLPKLPPMPAAVWPTNFIAPVQIWDVMKKHNNYNNIGGHAA